MYSFVKFIQHDRKLTNKYLEIRKIQDLKDNNFGWIVHFLGGLDLPPHGFRHWMVLLLKRDKCLRFSQDINQFYSEDNM